MIIHLESHATRGQIDQLLLVAQQSGARPRLAADQHAIGVGGATKALAQAVSSLPGVAQVEMDTSKYPLASRAFHPAKTIIRVGEVEIGGAQPVIMAGPCTVESERQLLATAHSVREVGAHILRGGAYKPRTSPYAFDGLGVEGLDLLARARAETGLPIITEVMEPGLVNLVAEYADILQIGSRNMQNYPLLRAAGRSGRPVMVKRGLAATVEEWLLAAEYMLAEGNEQVMLCERGVRSFDPATRHMLDLTAVPLLNTLTHLPIVVDPSHGTGRRALVPPMALAGLAAGADGLLIEVHAAPDEALCDGDQSIMPAELGQIIQRAEALQMALR